MNEKCSNVINEIIKLKIDNELVSPNLVADISYKMGIELNSEEIIYISDNF
jgi:hypothetical protein